MKAPNKQRKQEIATDTGDESPIILGEDSPIAVLEAEPEPIQAPLPVEVQVRSTGDSDKVRIVVTEAMSPPPVIGKYLCARELNVTKMPLRSTFIVPRYVAEVLKDAKKIEILE